MSFSGSQDAKERIRAATDIVDLVGAQIQLRRQGRSFVGLCPWHDDSKPSLQVNPERQTWKCWVCNIGGDVFSFVMQREGVDFPDALRMLADRAGIDIDTHRSQPRPQAGSRDDKHTLYRAMAWAADQFHQYLLNAPEAAVAREYLRERQIADASLEEFQIGFAPRQWSWLLDRARQASISTEVLEAVGLILRRERTGGHYDRFRGRVMFPIRDTQKRPIAVGGRILPALDDKKSAKYINSPETRLFSKSEQLYGFDLARDAVSQLQNIVVMEGYTDVIIAKQYGIPNAVAVLGTALGERHIQLIKRFAQKATLVLDGDDAGQKRANEILDLFAANPMVEARIVTLPHGNDPCDFLLEHGGNALQTLIDDACDMWEHKIRVETAGIDLIEDTYRANQALESLLAALARARRAQTSSASGAILERQVLNRLARQFQVELQHLNDRLEEARQQQREYKRIDRGAPEGSRKKPHLEPFEHQLFELLLMQPDLALPAVDALTAAHMETPAAKEIFKAYEQLVRENVMADLSHLLLAFDDPDMKNLLAECDLTRQSKQDRDVEWDLQAIIDAVHQRHLESQLKNDEQALQSDNLSHDEKMNRLRQLIQKRRELNTGDNRC